MNISFSNNQLIIDKQQISFDDPIKESREFKDLILVLLAIPQGKVNNRNVFAVNKKTLDVVWQIEEADLIYDDCPYTNFIDAQDEIFIGNWNGITYKINETNGSRLQGLQTK